MSDVPLVVLDASVAVKWFNAQGEAGVLEAGELLERHLEGELRLIAPTLLVHELHHAISRRCCDAPALGDAMDAFFDTNVALVAPDRDLMRSACALMQARGVSSADSVYAALARTLGCELATADRRFATALSGGVPIIVV